MNRTTRAAASVALAALLVLIATLPVAAASPDVVAALGSGTQEVTGDGSPHSLGGEINGAGTWWVTATAMIDAGFLGTGKTTEATCALNSDTGPTVIDQASWVLQTSPSGRSTESLFLTGVYTSGTTWEAELSCTATPYDVSISGISIIAAKGSPSASPRLISHSVDAPVSVAGGSTFRTVATLSVPTGNWWIVAKTNLTNTSSSATDNEKCRVSLSSTDVDQGGQSLYYTGQSGVSGEAVVQVAHRFAAAATAALQCSGKKPISADHVRLVAMMAGKLTRLAYPSTKSTSGTGTPKIIAGYRTASTALPSGTTQSLMVITLPAGKWVISAKVFLKDGSSTKVDCEVDTPVSYTNADSYGGPGGGQTGIYMQTAVSLSAQGNAALSCGADSSGPSVSYVRITAISANSLTFDE